MTIKEIDLVGQVIIGILGPLGFYMMSSSNIKVRKVACIISMVTQPSWYITLIYHEQYVMLPATIVYTLGWLRFFKNNFLRK